MTGYPPGDRIPGSLASKCRSGKEGSGCRFLGAAAALVLALDVLSY
jgi:hypothetical protein